MQTLNASVPSGSRGAVLTGSSLKTQLFTKTFYFHFGYKPATEASPRESLRPLPAPSPPPPTAAFAFVFTAATSFKSRDHALNRRKQRSFITHLDPGARG